VSVTRQQLEARLVMIYGGRAAEELIFGRDRVTTGASSDIQKATGLARRYVTQWGLSDAVGPVAISEAEQEVFLGRDLQSRREVSEKTAELVDAEVARVLNDALGRARTTLRDNVDHLHAIAQNLLERETLTREEVDLLMAGKPLPPIKSVDIPGPPEVPELPVAATERPKTPAPELKPRLA
jgi:cell division protease FtsH